MPIVLSGAKPTGKGGSDLVNGPAARAAFGGLAHALQDFYAHSNWVEDNIAVGQPDRMPPPLMPQCDPATLAAGLHTGFFSMDYSSQFPLEGCPPGGPSPGFAECHSTLNKDGWDTPRGIVPVPGRPGNTWRPTCSKPTGVHRAGVSGRRIATPLNEERS
jgi:hypothetical protein